MVNNKRVILCNKGIMWVKLVIFVNFIFKKKINFEFFFILFFFVCMYCLWENLGVYVFIEEKFCLMGLRFGWVLGNLGILYY